VLNEATIDAFLHLPVPAANDNRERGTPPMTLPEIVDGCREALRQCVPGSWQHAVCDAELAIAEQRLAAACEVAP
jgi:hypothetical protein